MRPTLCLSLKTGTLVSAILDLFISLVASVGSVGLLVTFVLREEEVMERFQDPTRHTFIDGFINVRELGSRTIRIFLIVLIVYWIQKIGLAILLLRGVQQDKRGRLRVWLLYSLVLLILSVIFFLATILLSILEWKGIPVYIAAFILREYTLWIVSSYTKKMRKSSGSPAQVGSDEVKYLHTSSYLPFCIEDMTKENWDNDTTVDMTLKETK